MDVGVIASPARPARSKPLNMPDDGVPVLIESGSASSFEQSPRLLDREVPGSCGESQLKEDLADAMLESPGRVRSDNGKLHTSIVQFYISDSALCLSVRTSL